MQTVKGLIALLLVAVAVFTAVTFYNSKTEGAYIAKLKGITATNTLETVKQAATKAMTNAVAGSGRQSRM